MKKLLVLLILAMFLVVGCNNSGKADTEADTEMDVETDADLIDVDDSSDNSTDIEVNDADEAEVVCAKGCFVEEICYPNDVLNPLNICQKCDTALSQTSWSDNDGAVCDDKSFCTENDLCSAGSCSGTEKVVTDNIGCNGLESCNEETNSIDTTGNQCVEDQICDLSTDTCVDLCTGCVIDSICYGEGQLNPLNICQKCDTALSQTSWSDNDGIACEDDGVFCNGTEVCGGGVCSPEGVSPCIESDTCFEEQSMCCEPGVPVTDLECNVSGDVVRKDSCDEEILIEDCLGAELNGGCSDGVCGCAPGFTGSTCDNCLIYINGDDGNDSDDGRSWENAVATIQDGLLKAEPQSCEVWVVKGSYTPGTNKTSTFQLLSGVNIYGGFIGSEILRTQRDFKVNETILSGDLGSDKSYHVVTGSDNAIIDGFTIKDGRADGRGSSGNYDDSRGAGMYNKDCSPTVVNCTFSSNYCDYQGAGMYNENSSATIINSVFSSNLADVFDGGGMFNNDASPTVVNSIFIKNHAYSGAGMYNSGSSNTVVINSTFVMNTSDYDGGGIRNMNSDFSAKNCIVWGNSAKFYGNQFQNDGPGTIVISYSDVEGGYSGATNIDADPEFVDAPNGDVRLKTGSPCIDVGSNDALPLDSIDLDGDENKTEKIPSDHDGNIRIVEDVVDMGAYEKQ